MYSIGFSIPKEKLCNDYIQKTKILSNLGCKFVSWDVCMYSSKCVSRNFILYIVQQSLFNFITNKIKTHQYFA
jgi:hypothetical protein